MSTIGVPVPVPDSRYQMRPPRTGSIASPGPSAGAVAGAAASGGDPAGASFLPPQPARVTVAATVSRTTAGTRRAVRRSVIWLLQPRVAPGAGRGAPGGETISGGMT